MSDLNPQQELFCKLYASDREFFGNGTQSYIEAYGVDATKPGSYAAARSSASEFLTNPNILDRINHYLDLGGLNDATVDKELLFVIRQHDDKASKVAAIREYNKLKQRITDKIDHTSGGKPIYNAYLPSNPIANGVATTPQTGDSPPQSSE